MSADYYVYVYIDPRNFEEFYYGKGRGSRRFAHLSDQSSSLKAQRIEAIYKAGLEPIVRTVAGSLTSEEAHLVETTLIWKLGKGLTNAVAGKHAAKFRPPDSFHKEIPRLDFQNDVLLVNVGQGPHRRWSDCMRIGMLSAGQDKKWRDQIVGLMPGDIVIPYVRGRGYVGVGRVTARAVPFSDFRWNAKPLSRCKLDAPSMSDNSDDLEMSEYVAAVEWINAVPLEEARWQPKSGLYTTQLIRSSLAGQPRTREYIEREFNVRLNDLTR